MAAQRSAINAFAASRNAEVSARFTEVKIGRNPDRPELQKAIYLAWLMDSTLVIARLDRLLRNAAFLACDMPEANDLTVGVMALVAQQERELLSRRTKEALAAAWARGVRLGNPNSAAALQRAGKGGAALREAVASNADACAAALAPVIADLQVKGQRGRVFKFRILRSLPVDAARESDRSGRRLGDKGCRQDKK